MEENDSWEFIRTASSENVRRWMKDEKIIPEEWWNDDLTLFTILILYGHYELADELLKGGYDINFRMSFSNINIYYGERHLSSLEFFVMAGKIQEITFLLDRGADIEIKNTSGKTSLQIACNNRDVEIVKLFLERGAKIPLRDDGEFDISELPINPVKDEILELLHYHFTLNKKGAK